MNKVIDLETRKPVQDTLERKRQILQRLYLRVRPRCATPHQALTHMCEIIRTRRHELPRETPTADLALLQRWCEDQHWEDVFRRRHFLKPVSDDEQRALDRVKEARAFTERAKDILDCVVQQIDDAFDVTLTADPKENPGIDPAIFRMYKIALEGHQSALADQAAAEDTLRQTVLERQDRERQARVEALTRDLQQQYEGLGPQYTLLCRRLAEVTVRIERANGSGRVVSADEFAKLYTLHTVAVNQLQKHTEATKSESVSKEARELVREALSIVEKVVAPSSPQLWSDAIRAVDRELTRRGAPAREATA